MKIRYNKTPINAADQLILLEKRGLFVDNSQTALSLLERVGYYRLSGYWYPFRHRKAGVVTDEFHPGSSFSQILEVYDFDCSLRRQLLAALETIEIAARSKFSNHFSLEYGPFGHTNPANFHQRFRHQEWLTRLNKDTQEAKETFVSHYRDKYQNFPDVPIWMLTEIMSLGALSRFYGGLSSTDKRKIAVDFDWHPKGLGDLVHTLTYIRNVCAHHSRIWNRDLAISCQAPRSKYWQDPYTPTNKRIFFVILAIKHLLSALDADLGWKDETEKLLNQFAISPNRLLAMGMSKDWKTHPLWADPHI